MRIIIPMLMFATACAEAPQASRGPSGNEDTVTVADPGLTYESYRGFERWVDSRYNVVCYAYSMDTLRCFPLNDEGAVQYSLDFQNQAD